MIAAIRLREAIASPPRAPESASRRNFCPSRKSSRSRAHRFASHRNISHRYDRARQDRQSLQTDPVGYESDLNLYAYTYNDPLNLRDTNGERPEGLAEAQNPYMRDSQRSSVPVDRGGAGPRNTTVQTGASMSFVAGAGGSGGGGRYSYFDDRGVETERGWSYSLSARAGVDIGANAGVTVTEGRPENFTGLDVNVNASVGLVTGSATNSFFDSVEGAPTDSSSGSGGLGPGLRLGASVGGGGTRFVPDQNFTPRQPPSFDVPLPGGGSTNCVATAQPDGSTTTQCSR